MLNITTFLNHLITTGGASLIEKNEFKNQYKITELTINEEGKLCYRVINEVYDKPYIVDGKINPSAKLELSMIYDYSEEAFNIEDILAYIIKSDFNNFETAIRSEDIEHTNDEIIASLLAMVSAMLKISTHSLVCSHCTEDNYLSRYLLESMASNSQNQETTSIEDIDLLERKLLERHNIIQSTGELLSNKETDHDTYTKVAYEWIDLYDDRAPLSLKCR